MNIKIIAVDLDGTLYSDKKIILPETADALRRASEKGIQIVPATGRPFSGLFYNIGNIDFINYVLTCNGAAMYEYKSGKCIYEAPVPSERSAELVKELSAFDISIDAFINGKAHKSKAQEALIDKLDFSEDMKKYLRNTRVYVDDLYEYIRSDNISVHKFTLNFVKNENGNFIDRDKTADYLYAQSDLSVVSGGMSNLEITLKGVNKGASLLKLGELLGVRRDEIMAFGDSENDLDMIRSAGFGIAMGNSEECVKNAAFAVTLSNNDNGIAAALKKYLDI